jgi:hypothetical protein
LQATAVAGTTTVTLPAATDTLVGKATTDTLTNKTLTTPVISTISNTGTLTLPTSTDTLVGRATTDTLTNKSIVATQLTGTQTIPRGTLPTGSVLQVVSSYTTTGTTTTSATPVDSALSATITPTSSSSKIFVLMSSNGYVAKSGVNVSGDMFLYIVRGSTQLTSGRTAINFGVTTWNDMFPAQHCYTYLDSPATTSATTYKMQISVSSSQSLTVPLASFATMTLMEISA